MSHTTIHHTTRHTILRIIALPFVAYIVYYNLLFWLKLPAPSHPEPAILLFAIPPTAISIYLGHVAPTNGHNGGYNILAAVLVIMGLATGLATALASVGVWLYFNFAVPQEDPTA